MTSEPQFPALTDWEATRQTLHLYSRAVGVVPRTHAEFHPMWWHISLKVQPDGLITDKIDRPGGGILWLNMDLKQHKTILFTDEGPHAEFDMTAGLSATEFGDNLLAAVAELGLSGDYARDKFENDDAREYSPQAAETFLTALVNADRIFKEHRASLSGDVGPVQLWPHGFDLAFEWFGTRVERYEEHGEVHEYPSQINLGFYPGDPANEPYFYSNPWPFEADLQLAHPLPEGANWHTEGWQGTILPYAELAGDERAEERLQAYAQAVYDVASPTCLVPS
ncbi:MAG: hypothetical protein JSW55_01470 [Chloroflexota bacterium]|nr:MAG: hypothetical protein JSW55_01470 [Chloroflexota bacterium]